MELKSCGTAHFIQTIRGGLVLKVCNIISHERPVIQSKILKDVYESEDAKRRQKPPSALVFDQQRVKHKGPYVQWADRTLREIKSEPDEFASHADDDLAGGLDDDTTLNQVKKRLLKRKRKYIPLDEISQRDDAHEKAVQDESDLNEPIINWKAKHSNTSKGKRKCMKMRVVSSSTIDIAIKSEEDLVSEFSSQVGRGPAPVGVKVEVPDTEELEWQNKISSRDASSIGHNEVPYPGQRMALNEYSREPVSLCVNAYGKCVTNEISYDHLEDVRPIPVIFLGDGVSAELEALETTSGNSPDFPSVGIEEQMRIQDSHPCRELISEDPIPSIKSEEDLVSDFSSQVGRGIAPVGVKVEVPDAEQLEWQNKISSRDASSIGHNEVPNPARKMVPNEYSREPASLCVNVYGNCDEISYDYLEDAQPISVIYPRDGASAELETLETTSGNSPDFPSVEIEKQMGVQDSHPCRELLSEDPIPDLSSHSRCSSSVENMPEESISGNQVSDMAIVGCMGLHQECNSVLSEGRTEADIPYEPNDALTSLDKNCGSNLDSVAPSKTEHNQTFMDDVVSNKKQSSPCSIISNELNYGGHVEDESLKTADKQNSAFTMTGAGNEDSLEHMTCDSAETTLLLEPHQPPERLLSTRKALSPSSQEQLRMAMNSDDICNDSNQNIVLECKEKLFENQTEKNRPNDEVMVNSRRPGQVTQRKATISPKRIIKKSQIAKGNLEGPRFSRALPNVSTACTSVQGCSEGAIAFSQRQLHDMETLAEKLMNELKSMKDIVEQKLLFEAYRNVSVKNDADEVKSAIHNASKVEETAKRWMSMMARDCTRFCKIMKMTPDSPTVSKGTPPGERRKITFADEAGGELCHVKFFYNGVVAPEGEPDAVKK